MNNLYKRPMFRKGGSAEGGITSGLGRPGYAENGSVEKLTTKEELLQGMGAQPSKQNFNDFLINFGLNMASNAPSGNIFQTAAAQAKDPYADFSKANQAEQDLLRKVGLEAASIDIGTRNAADAAKLIEEGKAKRLADEIAFKEKEFANQTEYDKEQRKLNWVDDYKSKRDYEVSDTEAKNAYEFFNNTTNKPEFRGKALDTVFLEDEVFSKEDGVTEFLNKKKNKAKKGKLLLHPTTGDIYTVVYNTDSEGYTLDKVGNTTSGATQIMKDTSVNVEPVESDGFTAKKDLSGNDIVVGGEVVVNKLSPKDVGFENKPVFENLREVRSIMKFPMTGIELMAKYEIPESAFQGYNLNQTFQPILPDASAYDKGDVVFNNIYKSLQTNQ